MNKQLHYIVKKDENFNSLQMKAEEFLNIYDTQPKQALYASFSNLPCVGAVSIFPGLGSKIQNIVLQKDVRDEKAGKFLSKEDELKIKLNGTIYWIHSESHESFFH